MDIAIIILAAGFGTRMKSNRAKVMNKICDKPMLSYIITSAKSISDDITCVLYHQNEIIKEYLNKEFPSIKIVIQDVEHYPGTGGALKNLKTDKKRVLILNGDMPLITSNDLSMMVELKNDMSIAVTEMDNATGYGRVKVNSSNTVTKIIEQKDCNIDELRINLVNSGIYLCYSNDLFRYIDRLNSNNRQREYYLTDIIEMACDEKKVVKPYMISSDSSFGVNSKVHLSYAETVINNRTKNTHMENGVIMHLPDTIYIEPSVEFFGECEIESNCTIKGKTKITNSTIKSGSYIKDALIKNSSIGPMARIRPNSNIIGSHIGNFVESKNSTLTDVKAGHLTYIGDTVANSGTNFGAGVITCNYDGVNKHKTNIGKNVFIGSTSQLVAPLNIADNTIIGAGTTVTKNIENSGNLVISRAPIKIISGYFYKIFKG